MKPDATNPLLLPLVRLCDAISAVQCFDRDPDDEFEEDDDDDDGPGLTEARARLDRRLEEARRAVRGEVNA